MYLGSFIIDDTCTLYCNSHTPSTGAAVDADAVPGYRIYEDETGTPILTGSYALLDDTNTVGFYSEQITLSAANGFEAGKSYSVRTTIVVGGVTGIQLDRLQIGARVDTRMLAGTIQSATDLKDFADDGYDPSTNKVQGVVLTDTLTTYTGNTVQTGDAFARLGAPAGASVSADILTIDNLVDDLESRVGTPSDLGGGATVAANLADIEAQTDDIGAAGAGLTAAGITAAGVRTAVGLASANLDTQLTTIDDFLDTEVAAIKAKTDALPASPANETTLAALVTTVGVAGAGLTAADDAVIAAIAALNNIAAGAAMTLTSAERNAIADAYLARSLGTEAVSADNAVPTVAQAFFEILSLLGEFSISGTTITCKKRDGTTTLFTSTLDSSSAPTSRTRAT